LWFPIITKFVLYDISGAIRALSRHGRDKPGHDSIG